MDTIPSVSSELDLPEFTEKQEAFIKAYLEHRRGRKAALIAGYTPGNASTAAYRMLSNPALMAEIKKRIAENGWTKTKCVSEINNTYTELIDKDPENWKERREFIQLMAKTMGYLDFSRETGPTFILQNCQVRLENYKNKLNTMQVVDNKEIASLLSNKCELESKPQDIVVFDDK